MKTHTDICVAGANNYHRTFLACGACPRGRFVPTVHTHTCALGPQHQFPCSWPHSQVSAAAAWMGAGSSSASSSSYVHQRVRLKAGAQTGRSRGSRGSCIRKAPSRCDTLTLAQRDIDFLGYAGVLAPGFRSLACPAPSSTTSHSYLAVHRSFVIADAALRLPLDRRPQGEAHNAGLPLPDSNGGLQRPPACC